MNRTVRNKPAPVLCLGASHEVRTAVHRGEYLEIDQSNKPLDVPEEVQPLETSNGYGIDRDRRTWNLKKYREVCDGIARQVENLKNRN